MARTRRRACPPTDDPRYRSDAAYGRRGNARKGIKDMREKKAKKE